MKIVILGGGFCGALVAKALDRRKDLEVILIDKKEYFEYTPSIWKLLTNPSYHKKIIVPYKQFLKRTRIITDPVVQVTPDLVETEQESITFDHLVLSTGIVYPIFLKNTTNVFTVKSGTEVAQHSKKVAKAKTILIIGGGLIGTEVAGELATQTPEKHIILVHPNDRLLERNTKSVSYYAKKFLEERDVQIIFGEKVIDHQNGFFVTDTKRRIKTDLGIWCAGIKSDPWYMKKFPASVFTEKKALKVGQSLQLEGYPNIFVGGDITGTPEEKTAACADRHAHLISMNIIRALQHKPLIKYKPISEPMVISLGKRDGILTYPPFMFPGFIPSFIKLAVEKIGVKRL